VTSEIIFSERERGCEPALGPYGEVHEFFPKAKVGRAKFVLPRCAAGDTACALHEVKRNARATIRHAPDADEVEPCFVS